MSKPKMLSLVVTSIFLATLWGCGSNMDSDSSTTATVDIADAALTGNCTVCHTVSVHTQISGIVGQNPDTDGGFGSAITHDCEACHGGGQYHHGEGPIPYPTPDVARCETCHESQVTSVLGSKHNAEDPANTAMIADGHDTGRCQRCHTAEGAVAFKNIVGDSAYLSATFVNSGTAPTPTQVEALPNLDANGNHILHNITCAACHSPLTKELLQFDITKWDPNGNLVSDQFDMCTGCHNLRYMDGKLAGSGQTYSVSTAIGADGIWFTADDAKSTGTATAQFYHNTSWYRSIASTHYDNPDSPSVIEGYVIREKGANPCFDCHGHELHTNTRYANTTDATRDATPSIYTDWAQSAHAGALLKAKYAVARTAGVNKSGTATLTDTVMSVGVTDSEIGNAWTHYNWDSSFKVDGTDADNYPDKDRVDCQRCHTATGVSNFLNGPVAYNPAANNFSHLSGWVGSTSTLPANWTVTTASNQNEVLYCWGCHSNAEKGILRNPGAIIETYAAATPGDPLTKVTFPNVGASNVCMGCHLGREVGQVVKNDQDSDGVRSFVNSHYLAAGATLFNESGYEYADKDYDDPTYFAHNKIGLSTPTAMTDSGPCVGCHMGTDTASHTFEVVEKSAEDVILAINSNTCVSCHAGNYALTAAGLEAEKEEYHAALAALDSALQAKGIYFYPAHPYFYTAAYVVGGTNTAFTDWASVYGLASWKDTMGAAFNYNLLEHDPGGYAHNRYYVKRLIFDAIDFIDNGDLGGEINVTDPGAAIYLDGNSSTVGVQRP